MRRQHKQDTSLYDPLSKIKSHEYKQTKKNNNNNLPKLDQPILLEALIPCSLRRNTNDKVQRADSTW